MPRRSEYQDFKSEKSALKMPRCSEYQDFNPKKRIENASTQSGRIAKLRLSKCSANSFEHCRTRAVYLNSPERPERTFAEQSPFSSVLPRQVIRG